MKNSLLLLILLITTIMAVPSIEITPFGGFQWNGESDQFGWYEDNIIGGGSYHTGYFDLEHNGNYGVFINMDIPAGTQLELNWTGNKSISRWRSNSNRYPSQNFDVMTNYWQVGGLKYLTKGDRFLPFINGSVGATMFSFDNSLYDNQWFFSVALGLGAKLMITDMIGIRFGSRFLIPINFQGVGFSFGSGGTSAGAYGYNPILQGDIHGGIIIKIGGKKSKKSVSKHVPSAPVAQPTSSSESMNSTKPTTRVENVSPTEVHIITE